MTDIAMLALMPLLMAYTLIGAKFHEIAGTVVFVLFLIHHILNRRWYKTLTKGRYRTVRWIQTIMDMLLLIFMIAQPISGILLSGYLFSFIHEPARITALARTIHLVLAFWGYILLCFHAGWHMAVPVRKLRDRNCLAWWLVILTAMVVSGYGCVAFVRRQFPVYLFGRAPFLFLKFREPKIYYFADYLAVMVLFMTLGALVMSIFLGRSGHSSRKSNSGKTDDK